MGEILPSLRSGGRPWGSGDEHPSKVFGSIALSRRGGGTSFLYALVHLLFLDFGQVSDVASNDNA